MAGRLIPEPTVKAVLVLDQDGHRLHAKYYDPDYVAPEFKENEARATFEKMLYQKTRNSGQRGEAEIVIVGSNTVVFRGGSDVLFYVCGGGKENELILVAVLDALFDALSLLLRDQMERRVLLDNLDLIMLAVDELVDGGVILEVDARAIASRVLMKGSDGDGTPISELTMAQALASAKDQISKSFQRS